MVQQSGGTVPVKSTRACVVYDPGNGHVHHIHQVVTFEGGREPSEHDIEARAISLAQQRVKRAGEFKVLHVQSEDVQPHQLYSVDLKTRTLLAKSRK